MKKKIAWFLAMVLLLTSCHPTNSEDIPTDGALNYVFYSKNGEIFYTALEKIEPKQLTEDLANKGAERDLIGHDNVQSVGSRVFFPDQRFREVEQDGQYKSFNIYCRELSEKDGKNILVDKDIMEYKISNDGEFATYRKANDDSLYQWHDGKVELIGENVPKYRSYYVSEDGKRIVFYDEGRRLYYKEFGKEKELIDQNILYDNSMCGDSAINTHNILYIDRAEREKSVIIYQKEENGKSYLYQKFLGAPGVKLGESVWRTHFLPAEFGSYQYFQVTERMVLLKDLVEDDLQEDTYGIREKIKKVDEEGYFKTYRFWYLEEDEFKLLDGEFFSWISEGDAEDGSLDAVLFHGYPKEPMEKAKLSEYADINHLKYDVYDKLAQKAKKYVPIKGDLLEIEKTYRNLTIDPEDTVMRYFEPTGNLVGDLYQREIHGDQVGESQKIFSDMPRSTIFIPSNNEIRAYVTEQGTKDELYVEGKKIDHGLLTSSLLRYDEKDHAIYYGIRDQEDQEADTLKVYRNGKTKVISKSVYEMELVSSGKMIYIRDQDEKEGGALYYYDGAKSILIDENVEDIFCHNSDFDLVQE